MHVYIIISKCIASSHWTMYQCEALNPTEREKGKPSSKFQGGYLDCYQYCWWKKSCTTRDVQNPVNNGITYISADAGFLPSTVGVVEVASSLFLFQTHRSGSSPVESIGTPNWWHQRSMQPHWAYSCYACRTECSCRWHPKQLQFELTKRINRTKRWTSKTNKTKQTNKQSNKTKQNKQTNKQTKKQWPSKTPPNTLINWTFLLAKRRMLKEKEETKCRNTIVIACMFCHFCVLSNCLG